MLWPGQIKEFCVGGIVQEYFGKLDPVGVSLGEGSKSERAEEGPSRMAPLQRTMTESNVAGAFSSEPAEPKEASAERDVFQETAAERYVPGGRSMRASMRLPGRPGVAARAGMGSSGRLMLMSNTFQSPGGSPAASPPLPSKRGPK